MIDVWKTLSGKHRFLQDTKIAMNSATPQDAIPPHTGMLLAAMRGLEAGPLCVVLPKSGDAPAILTLLYSICAFRETLPQRIAKVGQISFKVGDVVAVAPTGHVFEYRGIWEENPGYFLLGIQGEKAVRNMPLEAMLRLSRTQNMRPKGKLDTALLSPIRTGLDRLIGARTFDNPSLFSLNSVFVGNRTRFESIVGSLWFTTKTDGSAPECVQHLMPIGRLRESSGTHEIFVESSLDAGVPIVASTHSLERASRYVAGQTGSRPLVVVDGASICKDQQAWDALADSARVIVFADEGEHDAIALLARRCCPVWKVPARALADATDSAATPLHQIARWAAIRSRLEINVETVPETPLDDAAKQLVELDRLLRDAPESMGAKMVVRAWRLLNQAARSLGLAPTEERRRALEAWFAEVECELVSAALWTAEADITTLTNCVAVAKALLLHDHEKASPKAELLSLRLRQSPNPAVLACDASHQANIEVWLKKIGLGHVPVVTATALDDDGEYSNVVSPAWPRSSGLERASRALCSPTIDLICHPFEARWARGARRRLLRSQAYSSMAGGDVSKLLSRGAGTTVAAEEESSVDFENPGTESDPWAFERLAGSVRKGGASSAPKSEEIPARYVSFHGPTYAYLTASHRVPLANSVVGTQSRHGALTERTVDELRADDLVVFAEGGAKGVLYEMANAYLGGEATELRAVARRWRDALIRWGGDAAKFESAARQIGCRRHSATIAHWFDESMQIGPGGRADLDLIMKITEDSALRSSLDDVWTAIRRLRGEHTSAGARLHRDLLAGIAKNGARVDNDGSRIEVEGVGAVWIVRIEYIAESDDSRGRSEVNRLLRERGLL